MKNQKEVCKMFKFSKLVVICSLLILFCFCSQILGAINQKTLITNTKKQEEKIEKNILNNINIQKTYKTPIKLICTKISFHHFPIKVQRVYQQKQIIIQDDGIELHKILTITTDAHLWTKLFIEIVWRVPLLLLISLGLISNRKDLFILYATLLISLFIGLNFAKINYYWLAKYNIIVSMGLLISSLISVFPYIIIHRKSQYSFYFYLIGIYSFLSIVITTSSLAAIPLIKFSLKEYFVMLIRCMALGIILNQIKIATKYIKFKTT